MKLLQVHQHFIDRAWKDGAWKLADACKFSSDEITADQLKLILSRGERQLLVMERDEQKVGWGVVRIDQLPNLRVLHVCALVAPHAHFEEFFEQLKALAEAQGCSEIRCAAKPAQARLYQMKCGFEPVYQVLAVKV